MSITSILSNHYKKQLMDGNIDFSSDTFRMILMNNTFVFDRDSHATYSDVSADELAAGNGYALSGELLISGELTEDDANDRGKMTWSDASWTASSGDIGPTGSAVMIDFTSADDTVIGCVDYGSDYTIADASSFLIKDIAVATS